MSKPPMLTVKQAADALGLDERLVRERLIQGQLKGEKRNGVFRKKWFVFRSAIEAELQQTESAHVTSQSILLEPKDFAERSNPDSTEHSQLIDLADLTELELELEPDCHETARGASPGEMSFAPPLDDETVFVDALPVDMPGEAASDDVSCREESHRLSMIVEQLMKPLVEKLALQAQALAEQQIIIEEQGVQLRLLPDLQREIAERKSLAEAKVAEVSILTMEANSLREKLSLASEQADKIESLEKTIDELRVLDAQNASAASAATAELTRMEEQKSATLEQLGALQLELNKWKALPWWKRLLGMTE